MTNTENIPAYLREHGLFCLWKYEEVNGRTTKVPYNPNSPQDRAQSNNRSTFAPLDTAAARASGFDGIGVGIFGDISAIDIDHCIDDAGQLSPMAQDIVQTMDAYTETSPSGKGLRILFLAPGFRYDTEKYYINNQKSGLEIYLPGMTRKYVTVTGNTQRTRDILNRADRLQTILDKYMKRPQQPTQTIAPMPGTPADISDRDLLDKAMNARNGDTFKSLWDGSIMTYPSHSEADQALCNLLAFWTGKDAARMEALFRQSGLNRETGGKYKSPAHYTKYLQKTIQKAINSCVEVYAPQERIQAPQTHVQAPQAHEQPAGDRNNSNAPKTPQEAPQPPKTAAQLFDSFLEKVQTDIYKPLQTGMPAFDSMLGGGILRQSLVILSAAPGTGKTTLAQQIFETMATTGADVVFLNLEMSREQLLARSLSRMIHKNGYSMNAADVLKGYKWTDAQRGFVMEAADEYRSRVAPHFVYNPAGMGCTYQSIGTVLAKYGEAMKAQGRRAPVVVLDYLHIVQSDKKEDAQEIIKSTVQMLKEYAVKYDTFVFALSATNRTSNATGTITQESSRDSSGIEYTADYLLALNYKALALREKKDDGKPYKASDPNDMEKLQSKSPREMLAQVLKNRMNAAGGKLFLAFDSAHSIFYPMEKQNYTRNYSADDFISVDDADDNPFL